MGQFITENITSLAGSLDPYGEHSTEQNYQAALFLYDKELRQEAFAKTGECKYFYNQPNIETVTGFNTKLGEVLEKQSKMDWGHELEKYITGEETVLFPGYMGSWVSTLINYDKYNREDPYTTEPSRQLGVYVAKTLNKLYVSMNENSEGLFSRSISQEDKIGLKNLIEVINQDPSMANEWYKKIRSSYIDVIKTTENQVKDTQDEIEPLCKYFNKQFKLNSLEPRTLVFTKLSLEDTLDNYYPFSLDNYPTATTIKESDKPSVVLLKTEMDYKIGETGFPELRFLPVPKRVVFHEAMHAITNSKVREIETTSGTLRQVFSGLALRNYMGEIDLGTDSVSRDYEEGFISFVEIFIEADGDLAMVERLLGRKGFMLLDEGHTLPANVMYDSLRFGDVNGVDTNYYQLPQESVVFNKILSKCGNPSLLFGVLSDWANSNGVGSMEYAFSYLHEKKFQKEQFARLGITKYSLALDKQPKIVE